MCNEWTDWDVMCNDVMYLATVEECISKYTDFNSTWIGVGYDQFITSYCTVNGVSTQDLDVWKAASTHANVTVTDDKFVAAYLGEHNLLLQKDISVWEGAGIIIYWLFVFAMAAAQKWFYVVALRLSDRRRIMRRPRRSVRWLQRNIMLPPLITNGRHLRGFNFGWFSFHLATRLETIIIVVYIILVIIFMACPYTYLDNDPFFHTRWKGIMRYASDRSGIIAMVNLPLLLLFAMRNNVLIFITGWSYARFNVFHRAIARISFILMIVHAVTKHIFAQSYGMSLTQYYYPLAYFRWGCASIGLFSLIIFWGFLRARFYMLFHLFHFCMVFCALICTLYHLNGIGYKEPVYICFAIWGAEILARLLRIAIFNTNYLLPLIQGSRKNTFAAMRVFNRDIISVKLTLPVRWKAYPGQYVYLYVDRWNPLNGHPFSVIGTAPDGGVELACKKRNGMTKRLARKLINHGCNEHTPMTMSVVIEGPYGAEVPVHRYDQAIIVAGGIGITGVLGYLEKLSTQRDIHSPLIPAKLIWAVRDVCDVDPVIHRIYELSQRPNVEIMIYCRPSSSMPRVIMSDPIVDLVFASPSEPTMGPSPSFSSQGSLEKIPEGVIVDSELKDQKHGIVCREQLIGQLSSEPSSIDNVASTHLEIQRPMRSFRRDMHELSEAGIDDDFDYKNGYIEFQSDEPVTKIDAPSFPIKMTHTEPKKPDISHLIQEGRPDLVKILRAYLTQSEGSVAVIACGPPALLDCTANAVCRWLDAAEYGRVDYFEEGYLW